MTVLAEVCGACGAATAPPRGVCRSCASRDVAPLDMSGPLTVWSWTVNHQRWFPELEVPIVVVAAEHPDHPGVRILGELPEGGDVRIGMDVWARLDGDVVRFRTGAR